MHNNNYNIILTFIIKESVPFRMKSLKTRHRKRSSYFYFFRFGDIYFQLSYICKDVYIFMFLYTDK